MLQLKWKRIQLVFRQKKQTSFRITRRCFSLCSVNRNKEKMCIKWISRWNWGYRSTELFQTAFWGGLFSSSSGPLPVFRATKPSCFLHDHFSFALRLMGFHLHVPPWAWEHETLFRQGCPCIPCGTPGHLTFLTAGLAFGVKNHFGVKLNLASPRNGDISGLLLQDGHKDYELKLGIKQQEKQQVSSSVLSGQVGWP